MLAKQTMIPFSNGNTNFLELLTLFLIKADCKPFLFELQILHITLCNCMHSSMHQSSYHHSSHHGNDRKLYFSCTSTSGSSVTCKFCASWPCPSQWWTVYDI